MTQLNDIREPSYVPPGYTLRRRFDGADARGFGRTDDQCVLIYTSDWSDEAWHHALAVYQGHGGSLQLANTRGHAGERVDLGLADVQAIYHDGVWAPGPGPQQRTLGQALIVHWDSALAHSVTVRARDLVVAVQGPKTSLDRTVLARMAESALPTT
jgi:hypothetical protein